jgi:hypothetical protein
MAQVGKPNWVIVEGVLVEHASTPGYGSYCIYRLTSHKGEVLYASTQSWELLEFRLSWRDIPLDMVADWKYFTSIDEARRSVGNLTNEDLGIQPFEYDKSRYTAQPELHYCLCCGYKTIEGYETNFGYTKPPDTYAICPICWWQDDPVAFSHPDEVIGPNGVSLRQAQENFAEFGASERRLLPHARQPDENDERNLNWILS